MRTLILLGASGSIGSQTLDIIRKNPNDFSLFAVSVGKNIDVLEQLLNEFKTIKAAYCISPFDAAKLVKKYPDITFYHSKEGLPHLVEDNDADMVVNALVGFVGFKPSVITLQKNEILCLANKESLVVGGEYISNILKNGKGKLFPIDSEHVAISKCFKNLENSEAEKIILTASGGSLRDYPLDKLEKVKKEEALNHPTWSMGKKITIDSATMINKGFEIIEAHYLFGYENQNIEVLMHDESYIHSLLKVSEGYIAEIGKPDMHRPIKWALYEGSLENDVIFTIDYHNIDGCHFREFDSMRYPCVEIARKVIDLKGLYGAVLNASNEEAVYAFLDDKIGFLDIEKIVRKMMDEFKNNLQNPTLEDYEIADEFTRIKTKELIEKGGY